MVMPAHPFLIEFIERRVIEIQTAVK